VSVTGHLIPQVDIGLSAFGGIASSTVFLNLDASIGLNVSANEDSSGGSNDTTANAGGVQACVNADTELAVNIGAQAAFFDLFSASTGKTLFDKSFPLLQVRIHFFRIHAQQPVAKTPSMGCQKCVGLANATSLLPLPVLRRNHALRAGDDTSTSNSSKPSAKSQGLGCPLAIQLSQLVSEIIPVS
jgi:hypothetical protein